MWSGNSAKKGNETNAQFRFPNQQRCVVVFENCLRATEIISLPPIVARKKNKKNCFFQKTHCLRESYYYSSALESSSLAAAGAAIGAAFRPTLFISEAVVSGRATDTPAGKEWLRPQWLIPRIPLCIGIPSDHSAIKWISISR
ncbi:hypothetical protein Ddc_06492 [Ditylenchus destructor]|nr:hypothetical protein Ddc_06492 [Ditylenchus destructor]